MERTGSTSGLRSEDAGPLLGLAAAAEEKQRETALGACHVVTVTLSAVRRPNAISKLRGGKVAHCGTLV
ncbi:MAG TPA: hypothetical protein VI074_09400 [Propionibacteriaceae bacterium]